MDVTGADFHVIQGFAQPFEKRIEHFAVEVPMIVVDRPENPTFSNLFWDTPP
jgi:hypothetical protein